MQEVADRLDFHLSVVDLTAIPEEKRLDEAMALGRREAHVPFDIGQLPLIRVTLLRLSADHGILLLTTHEITFDGWCIRLLAHEFGTIAEALEANRAYDSARAAAAIRRLLPLAEGIFRQRRLRGGDRLLEKQIGGSALFRDCSGP